MWPCSNVIQIDEKLVYGILHVTMRWSVQGRLVLCGDYNTVDRGDSRELGEEVTWVKSEGR